jgi:hypothetical protein
LKNSIEGVLDGRGVFRGDKTLKGENDAWVLTGRIGDTKAAEQEWWSHHVAHPPYLELSPIVGVDPIAELFQHIATKLGKNRRHRFVSREGPGIT